MDLNYSNRRRGLRLVTYIVLLILCLNGSQAAMCCDPPGATITTPSKLTCSNGSITLNGDSPTPGVSYVWAGPRGVVSFSQNPSVSLPGTYNLTVTSPSGGCTSTASVVVLQDTVQPDARTAVSGVMDCTHPTITINGISSTQGVTFRWIGLGSYTSTDQNLSVIVDGGYTLMVTNTSNGCISTATAYVPKNIELPTASAYVSGNLTCVVNSVQLTSSSATSGVSYSWTGPGFSSPVLAQNTTTSIGGIYTVTTTNPINGCQSTSSVNVVQDIAKPGATITASNHIITCAAINANLSGSSPSIGVTYSWSGPNLNLTVQNVTVASTGTYVLTVNKAQNGCISRDTTIITVDKVRPVVTITPPNSITCTSGVITLQGSSSVPPESSLYRWMGPSGFGTLNGAVQTTSIAGGYILSVTNLSNGCMTTKPTVVQQDVDLPASVTASNNGPLTCAVNNVMLTGYSSTPGVNYTWIGPNGPYTGITASVSASGTYTLVVTNPVNGCSANTTTSVAQNRTPPALGY